MFAHSTQLKPRTVRSKRAPRPARNKSFHVEQVHLLQHCDEILRLEGGVVAEQGTYEELLASGGPSSPK